MSTIGLAVLCFGNWIPWRCFHFSDSFPQSIIRRLPVTRSVVYALILLMKLPSKLSISNSTGIASDVSVFPLSSFTVTLWQFLWRPNSAATSELRYIFVLASSKRAFTSTRRFPLFKITGTVRGATKLGASDAFKAIIVWDLSEAFCGSPSVTTWVTKAGDGLVEVWELTAEGVVVRFFWSLTVVKSTVKDCRSKFLSWTPTGDLWR